MEGVGKNTRNIDNLHIHKIALGEMLGKGTFNITANHLSSSLHQLNMDELETFPQHHQKKFEQMDSYLIDIEILKVAIKSTSGKDSLSDERNDFMLLDIHSFSFKERFMETINKVQNKLRTMFKSH